MRLEKFIMEKTKIFAEWMRRQGYEVIETQSSFWTIAGTRTFQAIPYFALLTPSKEELHQLLVQHNALALRYSAPVEPGPGALSYHVVYERGSYSLQDLPKKARHDVKKGLSIAKVEPISFSMLAGEGWELRLDTLRRQGRVGAESESWWRKLCQTAEYLQVFEPWGAIADGKLVACLLGYHCDDYYCILYQQSLAEYLRFGVNNALTFVTTAEVLARPEVRRIFYGVQSLDAPASVDEFKFRMGYEPKLVRQRVEFHPYLRPFINKASYSLLKMTDRVLPNNHIISKAEGVFRFYLNGNLPLSEQTIPPILSTPSLEP